MVFRRWKTIQRLQQGRYLLLRQEIRKAAHVEPGGMRHQHAQGYVGMRSVLGGRNMPARQVGIDVAVEVQLPCLHHAQDHHGRRYLTDRASRKQRIAIDFVIRASFPDSVPLHLPDLAIAQHRDGNAGDVVVRHPVVKRPVRNGPAGLHDRGAKVVFPGRIIGSRLSSRNERNRKSDEREDC